jgi:hypothetical protein
LSNSSTSVGGVDVGGSGYENDMTDDDEDVVDSESSADEADPLSPESNSGGVTGDLCSSPIRCGIGACAESVGREDIVSWDGTGILPEVWLSSIWELSMTMLLLR